jgi:polyphosphate kinase
MAGKGSGKKAKKAARAEGKKTGDGVPAILEPTVDAPRIDLKEGSFDIDDVALPAWVERLAFKSGGYPYDEPIKDKLYQADLELLQIELVKLQREVCTTGLRLVLLFEGRDAAGKGGAVFTFHQYLNPRSARVVALPKPTDVERGQWYFQRFAAQLPTAGEMVLFDRSWYNRAGVEPVMGFCTEAEHQRFLVAAPEFEKMLIDEGIVLFKFYLNIGQAMQLKRFHERRHNPLKLSKLSPIDYAALHKWDDYTKARDQMLAATDKPATPWTVVRSNDKRRARLNLIRHVLATMKYAGKDTNVVRKPDPLLVNGPRILAAD